MNTATNSSRDRVASILRTVAPERVADRLQDLQRRRGSYTVPGPDYLWSIDGYMKLQPFGIEIYAVIDATIRYLDLFWNYLLQLG